MSDHFDVLVIGAAIVDVLAAPADADVFHTGSAPMEEISMQPGGDALNEALVMNHLGTSVRLATKIGDDEAGQLLLNHCHRQQLNTDLIAITPEIPTGINIVLIDVQGERHFLTNPVSSLRRLYLEDIPFNVIPAARLVSFASIFVSPELNGSRLEKLFKEVKKQGKILCADMTRPKNGETLADISDAIAHVDYLFANYQEAALVSGKDDLDRIAEAFLDCGTKHIIIKTGKDGCFIRSAAQRHVIPAYPDARVTDTTGAGDSFAAAFIHALLQGHDLEHCGRFANATASFIIEQQGATSNLPALEAIEKRCYL